MTEIKVVDYSDKSFAVYGEGTRDIKEQIKSLNGKFNRNLKSVEDFEGGMGWVVSKKYEEELNELVGKYNSGEMNFSLPDTTGEFALPSTNLPLKNNSTYQYVKYKVYKPQVGMNVKLTSGTTEMVGEVVEVLSSKNVVDTAIIQFDNDKAKAVICNGSWQLFGSPHSHTLYFSTPN